MYVQKVQYLTYQLSIRNIRVNTKPPHPAGLALDGDGAGVPWPQKS